MLSKNHKVTLYEAGAHLGGHANTIDVATPEGNVGVDTGFIVYNERNYPNLVALFAHLGVETDKTEMSFALSSNGGAYEYAGSGLGGFRTAPERRPNKPLETAERYLPVFQDGAAAGGGHVSGNRSRHVPRPRRLFSRLHRKPYSAHGGRDLVDHHVGNAGISRAQLHRFLCQSWHAAVPEQAAMAVRSRRQPKLCKPVG
ncbi:FAD-dependent oxidoreductase [Roseibium salinum]|uniref:FAD-dependent oxidoreductase n=1 Tax=Roseibium salinum TaxID=1604349 RepID=UPI00360E0C70